MNTSFVRGSGLILAFLASTALAHAHPGHDDHELTWDFNHLAMHPVATAGCLVVLLAAAGAAWYLIRRFGGGRSVTKFDRS